MSTRIFIRLGAASVLAILMSGCASDSTGVSTALSKPLCAVSPSSCLYDGAYEPGEAAYAEQEARRLNQAQLSRLRGM
ncbi:hypothetical protein [Castellaniella sp.]|uniref:hypothetical protein n=1 Tax=Castellaniella sp. TaxID=1955812 RepID=UPI002AFE0E2D|nr:hypothetical protein [Castellaniella sp.]